MPKDIKDIGDCLQEQRLAIQHALLHLLVAKAKLAHLPLDQVRIRVKDDLDYALHYLRSHNTKDLDWLLKIARNPPSGELDKGIVNNCIKEILTLRSQTRTESFREKIAGQMQVVATHISVVVGDFDAIGSPLTEDQKKIVNAFIKESIKTDSELKQFSEELEKSECDLN